MSTFANRKNKILLSDYNYRRDIENRLFMADLTVLEVDILQEIVNGSLKTSIHNLGDNLNISLKELTPLLEKLGKSGLFRLQGTEILVDKEMRKYYEAQLIKFDDDFRPDMEYLIGLLNKVPIHALPNWYALPRSSDNIFQSIIEKFLITPKTYERYLQELVFDNPILDSILKEVFKAPNYKIKAKNLIEKFNLTREQFEENMLFLEFSLVCCISYNKSKNLWEEVVTPFHEWHEYLLFIQDTNPLIIKDVSKITPHYKHEFGFLNELNQFMSQLQKKPLTQKEIPSKILEVAKELKIVTVDKQKVSSNNLTQDWLDKNITEQAIYLYRHIINRLLNNPDPNAYSEKDFREIEKSLKRINHGGWVYFDDFIKGSLAAVGTTLPIYLYNKGKRWKYATPQYNEDELEYIKNVCCDYLLQTGMTSIGIHQDRLCLCLTTFGKHSIG